MSAALLLASTSIADFTEAVQLSLRETLAGALGGDYLWSMLSLLLWEEASAGLLVRYELVASALDDAAEAQRVASRLDAFSGDTSDTGLEAMLKDRALQRGQVAFAEHMGGVTVHDRAARGHARVPDAAVRADTVVAEVALAGVGIGDFTEEVAVSFRKALAWRLGADYEWFMICIMLQQELDGLLLLRYQVVAAALEDSAVAGTVASMLDDFTADGLTARLQLYATQEGAEAFAHKLESAAVRQHAAR